MRKIASSHSFISLREQEKIFIKHLHFFLSIKATKSTTHQKTKKNKASDHFLVRMKFLLVFWFTSYLFACKKYQCIDNKLCIDMPKRTRSHYAKNHKKSHKYAKTLVEKYKNHMTMNY